METMSVPVPTTSLVASGLYYSVVPEDERSIYEHAAGVTGLNEEICLLRVKIAYIVRNDPSNIKLLLRAIAVFERLTKTDHALFHRQDNHDGSASVPTNSSPITRVDKPSARRPFARPRQEPPARVLPDPSPHSHPTADNRTDSPAGIQEGLPSMAYGSGPLGATDDMAEVGASTTAAVATGEASSNPVAPTLEQGQNQPRAAHQSRQPDRKHKKKQKHGRR